MNRFVPLSLFRAYYTDQSRLLTKEGMLLFRERLDDQKDAILSELELTPSEFEHFRETLNAPSNVVFYGWIEQDTVLSNLLTQGNLSVFEDRSKRLEHQLANHFKRFVSPFVSNTLMQIQAENDEQRMRAMSFVCLLDTDHRAIIEDFLFKSIDQRIKGLKEYASLVTKEQELVDQVKPLCSAEIIASVNYLSKASYAKKLAYVDGILAAMKYKACTVRFANWILKQVENVHLNHEHEYKITNLKNDLKQGDLTVRNHGLKRTPIQFKTIATTTFVAGIAFLIFYIFYYQPFSTVQEAPNNPNSAFRNFTKEERMKIDSLLQEINHAPTPDDVEIDPIYNGGGSAMLRLRKAFKNPKMEAIYDDLILDADIRENYPPDSCKASGDLANHDRLPGISDLTRKVSGVETMIKNESAYDIVVYVSENRTNGKVYSMYLGKGDTKTFKMEKLNTLLIVPGNHYQHFITPNGARQDELPSENFKHHFCDTDYNYRESVNSAYQLTKIKQGKTKFLVSGDQSRGIRLVDIHQVLEAY